MLAIGRALMTRRLLMLDEPSQGIMQSWSTNLCRVKRIRDAGMTVLIVEQRMSEFSRSPTATSCRPAVC